LSLCLQDMGTELCGFSLVPPTNPSLFESARVGAGMKSLVSDICDLPALTQALANHKPEIVIHMAAQPLVRRSYAEPIETYLTNVIGTANVLEAVRRTEGVRAVLVITTDKCYENREWQWAYREIDGLGGHDPYSSSKACAELVVSAYRSSYFPPERFSQHGTAIASARAGNVIGGGDWAENRLVPDIVRALLNNEPIRIRNPRGIRPWQHVLEPLRGYLLLCECLYEKGPDYGEAWNFGPEHTDAVSVLKLVESIGELWGNGARWTVDDGQHPHEAHTLKLDCSKAAARLEWRPALPLREALRMTTEWYQAWSINTDMRNFTMTQIRSYEGIVSRDTFAVRAGVR
jgi:CDP-glucose 4,6-dehydratase